MQLKDKIAVVTGAGRGVGRAIALAFAREGAHIVIAERQTALAKQVADEVRALGVQALAVETDVAHEESVAALIEQAFSTFGTLDLIVSNAGIQRRYFVQDLPTSEFQNILDVNLLGAFHVCKAALPTLYGKRDGNIIIIASDSGKRGYAFNAAYCASKFGVLGFMEALADEAKPYRVRVNAICPAGVDTTMTASVKRGDGSSYDASGMMQPEEIADVALFLASPQSRAIHGQALNVYGGVDYLNPAQ